VTKYFMADLSSFLTGLKSWTVSTLAAPVPSKVLKIFPPVGFFKSPLLNGETHDNEGEGDPMPVQRVD